MKGKSIFSFIISPIGQRYISNDKNNFISSVAVNDVKNINRYAKVIAVPCGYTGDIKVGDTIIVHHNTFRYWENAHGIQLSSFLIKDDMFICDPDMVFAIVKDDVLYPLDDIIFVKPLIDTTFFCPKRERALRGELIYINDETRKMGLKEGDEVVYEPWSEYEFNINGEKLFKMYNRNLMLQL